MTSIATLPEAEAVSVMIDSTDEYTAAKENNRAVRQALLDLRAAMTDAETADFTADNAVAAALTRLAGLFASFEKIEIPVLQAAIDGLPNPETVQTLFALLTGGMESGGSPALMDTLSLEESGVPTGDAASNEEPVPADNIGLTSGDDMAVGGGDANAALLAMLYEELGIVTDETNSDDDPLGDFLIGLADALADIESRITFLTFDMESEAAQSYLSEKLGEERLAKYGALYSLVSGVGGAMPLAGTAASLEGDWVYLSRFAVSEIIDGTGPFDTSPDSSAPDYSGRQGNDSANNNKTVRTFDSVTYNLEYQTAMSGEYDNVKEGYLFYEFTLPYGASQAEYDFGNMLWCGLKYDDLAAVPAKSSGYMLTVDGSQQILRGKKWLEAAAPNPNAFPGSGTLNAVVKVLAMKNGDTVQPTFKAWMDHNTTDGPCPVEGHKNRDEVKTITAEPVSVTAQLRLNVDLKQASSYYISGTDDFDFSTGNDKALNKSAGIVNGRIVCYGVTLQLYNDNANRGLMGCEMPDGNPRHAGRILFLHLPKGRRPDAPGFPRRHEPIHAAGVEL